MNELDDLVEWWPDRSFERKPEDGVENDMRIRKG